MLMQKTRIRTYKQMTKREILADSLLLLTALIWGCAFAVVKNALDSFPPGAIIAMRYLIAAAITGILFRRHLKELTRGDVARGALVGLLLFGAYIVQTTGLQYTTAGKNAFLTTVYVAARSVWVRAAIPSKAAKEQPDCGGDDARGDRPAVAGRTGRRTESG